MNANQTCGTIEEMLGSRRGLHLAMLENYALEIQGELQARLDSQVDARALDCRPGTWALHIARRKREFDSGCMQIEEPLEKPMLLNKRTNGCSCGEKAACRIDWVHSFSKRCRRAEEIAALLSSQRCCNSSGLNPPTDSTLNQPPTNPVSAAWGTQHILQCGPLAA